MRPSRFVAITVVCLALGSGCAHLPKPDGEPGPSKRDSLYLDPSPASRLVIELDRIEGSNPRPRALAIFLERLNKTLDKPGGIDLVVEPPVPPHMAAWTLASRGPGLARATASDSSRLPWAVLGAWPVNIRNSISLHRALPSISP